MEYLVRRSLQQLIEGDVERPAEQYGVRQGDPAGAGLKGPDHRRRPAELVGEVLLAQPGARSRRAHVARNQLGGEYVVAGVAAVVATTACVVVGPGLPELVSRVPGYVGSGGDDADLAESAKISLAVPVAGCAVTDLGMGAARGGRVDPAGSAPAAG
jgi:hypothetical protein